MITPTTRLLRWGLDIVEIPPLRVSSNGWVYGFDGKSIGRGSEGDYAGRALLKERRRNAYEKHGWRIPDQIEPKIEKRQYASGLMLAYDHPIFGAISIEFYPHRNYMSVTVHDAITEMALQDLDARRNYGRWDAHNVSEEGKFHLVANDLWNVAWKQFPQLFDFIGVESPEVAWTQGELRDLGGGFYTYAEDSSYWWTLDSDQLEQVASKQMETFVDIMDALGHDEVHVGTTYTGPDGGSTISFIRVTGKDEAQDLDHTVTFYPAGKVEVKCGYIADETRYLEFQKRNIAGWINKNQDLFEEVDLADLNERNE